MDKRLLHFFVMLLLILLCTACDPVGMSQMNLLGDLLNSDVGPTLSAEQLLDSIESLNQRKEGFSIHFPVTDENTSPKDDGIYVNPKTGSSIQFDLTPADSLYGIGTVAIVQQTDGELSFGHNLLTASSRFMSSHEARVFMPSILPLLAATVSLAEFGVVCYSTSILRVTAS